MKTSTQRMTEYGDWMVERVNEFIAQIANGAKWNGVIYIKQNKVASLYLDGKYCLLADYKGEVQEIREIFLLMLSDAQKESIKTQVIPTTKKDTYKFGSENWWASGMNGE